EVSSGRRGETVQQLRLTDDGAYVVAAVRDNRRQTELMSLSGTGNSVTVRVWDVATGKECLEIPDVQWSFVIGPDGRTVIARHRGGADHHFRWSDPATGAVRDGPPLGVGATTWAGTNTLLSPDRRWLATKRQVESAGP